MKQSYLEVTYRKGRPLAAYFYLPRHEGDTSVRTENEQGGLLVDFAADGRPIGIEITSPETVNLALLNALLGRLGCQPATSDDLLPLAAA
jgi:hypothetical protein